MLKIENTEVLGWEHSIRGMRNPMNSWEKSDSRFGFGAVLCNDCPNSDKNLCGQNCLDIGPNDLDLMKRLRNAGTDHRKFMRMITVYVDLTAPLYWWKEFDTYKVGTVANSCSTMHKIAAKRFERYDFSHEHLMDGGNYILNATIDMLNKYRGQYLDSKDKQYWWQMIQLLPSSYNQRRTVMLNYEVLANIYKSRRNHKLDEWTKGFIPWIESLPYSEIITGKSAAEESYEKGQALMEGMKKVIDPVERASEASRAMSDIMGSLKDLKKELGVVSPSKVSDKSDDGILVGALDIYTISLNDEDLKKISAGEEIELNMDVEGEDKILRSISICIKKEPVKEG